MKKLTFLFFIILNSFLVFAPIQRDDQGNFTLYVSGSIVNKFGETSESTRDVDVKHLHDGSVVGSDKTDDESNFTINSVITAIGDINGQENYLKMLQSNPFSYNTSFEVSIDSPGKLVEFSVDGKILGVRELESAGIYKFNYDGHGGADGMRLISVITQDGWKENLKLVQQGGSGGNQGVKNISFEDAYNELFGLKSATEEVDTLDVSGNNISSEQIEFTHYKQDIDLGQIVVNQGPEVTPLDIINTTTGKEVNINLDNNVYNDGQSIYSEEDELFSIDGSVLSFSSDVAGLYSTTITVMDEEDPNLTKELEVKVNVVEGDDITPPEFAIDTLRGREDEAIIFNLDEGANDNKTTSGEISWSIDNGSFTTTSIDGRVASFTPEANKNGYDKAKATITDLAGNISEKDLILYYENVPDAPEAVNDNYQVQFETKTNLKVLANDKDPDNDIQPSLVKIVTAPQHGTASVNADGSIDYTPNPGFEGNDFFEYQNEDETGLTDVGRADLVVNSNPNNLPVAFNDVASTAYQTAKNNIDVAANDTDQDGNIDLTSVVITQAPVNGVASVGADGKIDYTPNNGFSGTEIIKYTIKDQKGAESNEATLTINVAEKPNEAPIANNDVASTAYQTSKTIDVLANDNDSDGSLVPSSVNITQQPNNGSASTDANGRIIYTPNNGFSGSDIVKYTVKDDDGAISNVAEVSITVSAKPNVAPVANNDAASTAYQTAKNDIDVAANDSDEDGNLDVASTFITQQPANGSASVGVDGKIDYTPNNGFSGSDVVKYKIKDMDGLVSNEATLTITVSEDDNQAPTANDDVTSTKYNTPKTIDVLANDSDGDGSLVPSSVTVTQQPSHGSISINTTTGAITYTPNNGFGGDDGFQYTVKDDDGATSNVATVGIRVNQPPIANNDAVSTDYQTSTTINELLNDTDNDGTIDNNSVVITQQPSNGSTSIDTNGRIIYTPNNGFSGSDVIKYTVKDNDGDVSNEAIITVTVGAKPNVAPVANNDAASTAYQTAKNDIDVAANDSDEDGNLDVASTFITQQPANGSASVGVDGKIDYTPNNGFSGSDVVKYKIKDLEGLVSNEASLTITVAEKPNEAPIANNDAASTAYQTAKTIDILANDTDSDGSLVPSSVSVTQQPSNGSTSVNTTTGAITYTPNNGFSGSDIVKYTVKDDDGATSNVATVTVTVNPKPNVAPVANDDAASTAYQTAKNDINVAANDSDEDGNLDVASTFITQAPANGSASVGVDGKIDYTPNNGFSGTDNVKYKIKDLEGLISNEATLTITVAAAPNNPPTANNDAATTPYQTAKTIDVLANDSDSDGTIDKTSVSITQNPLHGSVSVNSTTGEVTYTPNNGYSGPDSFQYKVKDDDGDYSNIATVTMTVEEQQVQMSNVTFKFRAASTDQDLTSGTSTLRYKKSGAASYTTLTSTNGTFVVQMEKNVSYEIDGSNSGDLETAFSAPSVYLALKRTGDLEAFEQRAVDDASSPATFTQDNETIYLYKLMSDFPLRLMQEYASKAGGANIGTRKFSVDDKNAPIWWNKNYNDYTAEQRQWISDLASDLTSLPHVYLTLPFQEGTSTPSSPFVGISVDQSFPGPGTNGTAYNTNNEITVASAAYPDSHGEYIFKIEILQAIGDLDDVGGVNPNIVNPQAQGYTLNTTGQKIFSVMYLFQPKTKF